MVDNIPECVAAGSLSEVKQISAFCDLQLADPDYTSSSSLELLLGIAHCNWCSLPGAIFSPGKT